MQKHALTLFVALLVPLAFFAQNPVPLQCGNDLFSQIVRTHHPDLAAGFDATFDAARQPRATPRGPLTIQVVVHVVWNEAEENLSDDLINAQIAVLNADFNRQNADTANLRPIFQPVAGSADIHFELAAIERVQTSTLFAVDLFGTNLLPEVKHAAQGGSDAWDTGHYLNIWVCKIQPIAIGPIVIGQILGFAFPPGGLVNWPDGSSAPNADEDGVVIDYRTFGPDNPIPVEIPGGGGNLVVKGRTPVHEIGHYLGLRHIWGDGGLLGPNDCAQSDGVDDTPFADAQSSFDCDITKNTCPQIEPFYGSDMPDLIENYMDYASEDCMNMFTQGQVALMRNVLAGPRSGLVESVGIPQTADVNWHLAPNPAQDYVRLSLGQPAETACSVRLFDAKGRLCQTGTLPAENTSLRLETGRLPAGMYWVECRDAQRVSGQKLVIR